MNLKESRTIKPSRSTVVREAYFLKYASEIKEHISLPLAVTGGFRSTDGMNKALETNACDIIGLGRPLCSEPDLVNNLLISLNILETSYQKFSFLSISFRGVMVSTMVCHA